MSMAFTIDDALLPAILTAQPMTDEQFAEFCSEHPDLFFETSAEGELIVMPPNYTLTAYRHRAILTQLDRWAQVDGRGGVADAAGGFVLPNGASRAPDAAWTLTSRVRDLDPINAGTLLAFVPGFCHRSAISDRPLARASQEDARVD